MAHQDNLKTTCRLCLQEVSGSAYFTVKNVAIKNFLSEHYEDTPNFEAEDKTKCPKCKQIGFVRPRQS